MDVLALRVIIVPLERCNARGGGHEQQRLAEGGAKALDASGKFDTPIATSIEPASEFYVAEAFHQDYYLKSPLKYKYYRYRSGRDQFIEAMWAGDDTVYQSTR